MSGEIEQQIKQLVQENQPDKALAQLENLPADKNLWQMWIVSQTRNTDRFQELWKSNLQLTYKDFLTQQDLRHTTQDITWTPPSHEVVGRDTFIAQVKTHLMRGETVGISGLPGVGKTTITQMIVNDPELQAFFSHDVLNAELGLETGLTDDTLRQWAEAIGAEMSAFDALTTHEERVNLIHEQIGAKHMLLVIDDVWRESDLVLINTRGQNCSVLVTSRNAVLMQERCDIAFRLEELTEEDSLQLIKNLASSIKFTRGNEIEAREVIQTVGGLPLALVIAGKALNRYGKGRNVRVKQYLEDLRVQEKRLNAEWTIERGRVSLQSVIRQSDQMLADSNAKTQKLFYFLSLFPAKPNSFAQDAAEALSSEKVSLHMLSEFGLIETVQDRYRLHPTVHDYASLCYRRLDQTIRLHTEKNMLTFYVSNVIQKDADLLRPEVENIHALRNIVETNALNTKDPYAYIRLLTISGNLEQRLRGNGQKAHDYWQQALEIAERTKNKERIATLASNLARWHTRAGEFTEAETYFEKAIAAAEDLPENLALIHENWSNFYAVPGNENPAKALEHANLSVQYVQQSADIGRQFHAYETLVIAILNQAQIDTIALKNALNQADSIAQKAVEIEQNHSLMRWHATLKAEAALVQHDYAEAENTLLQSITVPNPADSYELVETVGYILTDIGQARLESDKGCETLQPEVWEQIRQQCDDTGVDATLLNDIESIFAAIREKCK